MKPHEVSRAEKTHTYLFEYHKMATFTCEKMQWWCLCSTLLSIIDLTCPKSFLEEIQGLRLTPPRNR